jgi:hypothetical protein
MIDLGCSAREDIEIGQHVADADLEKVEERLAQRLAERVDMRAGHIIISTMPEEKFSQTNSTALNSA